MTPERMAALVARWVRLYTRNLPEPVAERRIDEIEADVNDHIAHERARGSGDGRIALGILSRMVRGLAADASWRRRHAESSRPARRIALATALILLVPLVAMQLTDEVDWGVFDFVSAGALLGGSGLLLHTLATRKAGSLTYPVVAGAIGVAAIVLGAADDAPGLVAFGLLLIVATIALAVRNAQRSRG
jgi:hypothetical protein